MIACSLICSAVFSGAYGIWRINEYFQFHHAELERRWLTSLARILVVAAPMALAAWWLTVNLDNLIRLAICGIVTGATSGYLFYRWGMPVELRAELLARLRARFA